MRVVKKVLFYGVISLGTFMGIAFGVVYLYQDKIVNLFITEANKYLKTKVEAEKISVSLFDKFPQVAVSIDKVNITEALPESEESLGRAQKLYFTFSLIDIVRGKYNVRELYVEKGAIYVKVLPNGNVNYHIIVTDSTSTGEDFSFNLEKINLSEVTVNYSDQKLKHVYDVAAHKLEAALYISSEAIAVQTKGKATVNTIKIGSGEYFKGKAVDLGTALKINRQQQSVQIQPSLLEIEQASYEIAGAIGYAETTELDLKLNGKKTDIQSLLSLLPQSLTKDYKQYRSEGDIYFNGTVKGKVSAKENPAITFNFGGRNASFYHPDVKQRVEKLNFEGSFTNGGKQNATTSALEVKNIKGVLNKRPFSGNITYKNFDDPTVSFDAKGMIDIGYILGIVKLDEVKSGSGLADVHISFSGNLKQFKNKPGNNTLNTSGDITLHNVALSLKKLPLPLTNLNGNFIFKRNDVGVSNFKGKLGASDFALNGLFKNGMAWLLLDKQRLLVEADFKSNYLNFDQLLREEFNTSAASRQGSATSDYRLEVSPYMAFDLTASIGRLRFRRFKGESINGSIKLRNQVISSPNISFNAIGGNFAVRGNLNARQRNHLVLQTASKLNNMHVDSLFYVFENFNQNFIVDRHLKGKLTANIVSEVYFDSHLSPKTDLLQAEISATVRNGQLINFAPMQKMSVFVKRAELANMQFSELHNNFWIQKRTIYIPEMDIRSNLSSIPVIAVSGMHTFDQQMDYKIKMPLPVKRKPDKDAVYGVVAEDPDAGNSMLFLTLKGKESDFKIAYDKQRVQEKIKTDLKQEGQELKALLKGKKPQKKEKKVELQEGEFFDFN